MLSGEGADEIFGGYPIYREPQSVALLSGLPEPVRRGLRLVARAIPEGVKGRSFLQRAMTPLTQRFNGNARIFTDDSEISALLHHNDPAVHYTDITAPLYAQAAADGLDDTTTMQYIDMHTWLRGDILVKADRMSMAHSLELRVPFLDPEVFAIASQIPLALKVPSRPATTKYALRQALRGIVPPHIVNRPELGFPTPTRVWLAGPMYEWARHLIQDSSAGDLLDLGYADLLLREHRGGHADHSRKIWIVLVFCIWHSIFVSRTLDPGISPNPPALTAKPALAKRINAAGSRPGK